MSERSLLVVKYGGAAMTDVAARNDVASALRAARTAGHDLVVVHGGGPAIGQALAAAGIANEFVDGRRVTTPRAIPVVEAALTLLGKQLAQELGDAVGLTGRDAGLLVAEPLEPALGRVGIVRAVRKDRLEALLSVGLTPVIASLALDELGEPLNVNADEAGGAVAGSLGAPILFLTDVAGVLEDPNDPSSRLHVLHRAEAEARIRDGRVSGGMIPKVRAALEALDRGAPSARIADGRTRATVEDALSNRGGTSVEPDSPIRTVA